MRSSWWIFPAYGPTTLGTLTVGADGTGSAVFTVPADAEPGVHTVALVAADGEVTATVTVVAPGAAGPAPEPIEPTGQPDESPLLLAWVGAGALLLGLWLLGIAHQRRRRTA